MESRPQKLKLHTKFANVNLATSANHKSHYAAIAFRLENTLELLEN